MMLVFQFSLHLNVRVLIYLFRRSIDLIIYIYIFKQIASPRSAYYSVADLGSVVRGGGGTDNFKGPRELQRSVKLTNLVN